MHTGGRVTGTGLAYLEAGEQVVPKARVDRSEQMDGGGDTYVTFEEGAITQREGEDTEALAHRIAEILRTDNKRALQRKASRNA
jgi:hypothetical protein